MKYALSFWNKNPQYQKLMVIGLAKDGRLIYGPYKNDGTLWQPCDLDMCNGRVINGRYGYAATVFYPYFVGCWGPSNPSTLYPSCTSNPRRCLESSASYLGSLMMSMTVLMLVLF